MNEQTVRNVPEILKRAQELLDAASRRSKFRLQITDHSIDADWVTIIVTPTKEGIGAYDYAMILSKVEKDLRSQGDERVLLVPVAAE